MGYFCYRISLQKVTIMVLRPSNAEDLAKKESIRAAVQDGRSSEWFLSKNWVVLESKALKFLVFSTRFSFTVSPYVAPSILSSTLISFPVPANDKHCNNTMLPPPGHLVLQSCQAANISDFNQTNTLSRFSTHRLNLVRSYFSV